MSRDVDVYLSLNKLTKSFGGVQVLHNISLDCQKGDLVCLLGPSGCGKTTLLRIIAGLETQSSGQIFQDQQDISYKRVQERDFGMVFQSYALFPNLTVGQNIAYGLYRQPKKQAALRVQELLKTMELEIHVDKYPSQLSGGQQQRVALARALAPSPGLLLLDEPLSALDARVRASLRQEIKSIQRRLGITTILVTHDQEEAMSMADKIVVMNSGYIEQVGTPIEIYTRPKNSFVANFLGVVNLLPVVEQMNQTMCLGQVIKCVTTPSCVKENQLKASIRPEHILVSPLSCSKGAKAMVEKIEFLGAYVRLFLSLPWADDCYSVTADVDSDYFLEQDIAQGKSVTVYFKASKYALVE